MKYDIAAEIIRQAIKRQWLNSGLQIQSIHDSFCRLFITASRYKFAVNESIPRRRYGIKQEKNSLVSQRTTSRITIKLYGFVKH